MSTIQKYWRTAAKARQRTLRSTDVVVIDPVVCADGFSMSVQASRGHYSIPRWKTLKTGRYERWEVMALSRPLPRSLAKFCSDDKFTVGSVCGFVPTEIVDAIIEKHGGLE